MQNIVKTAILFVLGSLVLSFFGTYLTAMFSSVSGTLTYATNPYNIGLILTSVWSYLSWSFDILFFSNSISYTNQVMDSSIVIGSISWSLTLFRILLGSTLIVLIISLIFGGKYE